MFHDTLSEINSDLSRYLAVTVDDVRRVANKYLDPRNAVDVIIRTGPGGGLSQPSGADGATPAGGSQNP